MKYFIPATVGLVTFFSVVACNLYAPFTANTTQEDHLEEAQKCLHEGNFSCAVDNYQLLTDEKLKNEKLCTVSMARAGFTLTNLINTVTQKSDSVLGNLARNISPWTTEKKTAADDAKSYCKSYKDSVASGTDNEKNLGTLLRALSVLLHCSNRISRADLYQGTSDADEECTTAGNADGEIDTSDISTSNDGTIGAGQKGMCTTDVIACRDDVSSLTKDELEKAGLGDIASALDSIPADLKDDNAVTAVVRGALRNVVD